MRRLKFGILLFAFTLYFAAPSFATIVHVAGDPSTLGTALDITGVYPTEIIGTLDGVNQNDVNIFELDILNPVDFSAITLDVGAFGIPDTALFLFDSTGLGIYMNDDISGADTFSCLPSTDASNPCPVSFAGPLASGIYYLAISRSANYPIDASSNEIFQPVSSTDVVGPNPAAGTLSGWDGGTFTDPDFDDTGYDILLTGTTPEPATYWMTAMGGAILVALRKRYSSRRF